MALPPDELYRKQEAEVGRYADTRSARLLRMLETARKEISATISDAETFTARRIIALTSEIDGIMADLRRDIHGVGEAATDLGHMAASHLQTSIVAVTGVKVDISIGSLNLDILKQFSSTNVARIAKIIDAEKDVIRSVLFTKVGVKGENPRQVAKRLAGPDSQFAGRFGHVENILRTETSTIYNAQSLEGIQVANTDYDLALNKRIVETIDSKRNHPISQVLNGQVQLAGEPFRASVAQVQAKASAMHKTVGGIFWPIKNGFYEGQRLPAHYRERGIVVPTEKEVNI